jgi:hypothetical protein
MLKKMKRSLDHLSPILGVLGFLLFRGSFFRWHFRAVFTTHSTPGTLIHPHCNQPNGHFGEGAVGFISSELCHGEISEAGEEREQLRGGNLWRGLQS